MKILIPILGFGKGGGNRVLSRLADEFIREGHKVSFLVPYFSLQPYFPTIADIIWIDKDGSLSMQKPVNESKGNFLKIMYCLYKGLKRCRYNNFDIILANHSLTTLPIYFSSNESSGLFYYIQAYEPEYYQLLPGIKNRIIGVLSRLSYSLRFTQIINSESYSTHKAINTIKVVHPGLDLDIFYNKKHRKREAERKKIKIGTIGRSEPQKGTAYIVKAYEKLVKIRQDVEFVIAFGEGLEENRELGISIVKPSGDIALADYYRDIDIYISAGIVQHGAIHYPVLEAMAVGTHVITTDYYPANNENAWIIESKNEDDIVMKILAILDNPLEAECKALKASEIVRQFEWSIVARKMISYFYK